MIRINIRLKLFLIIASTLFLLAGLFIGTINVVIKRMILNQYEAEMVNKLMDFRRDFHEDLDFSHYVRIHEIGIKGFITLFDEDLTVLASSSPQLSHEPHVPFEYINIIRDQFEDPDFDHTLFNYVLRRNNIDALGLIGRVSDSRFILIEKALDTIQATTEIAIRAMIYSLVVLLFLGFILAYFFSYLFTKPIFMINRKAKSIAALDFHQQLVIKNNDEIGDLGNSINEISHKLSEYVDELQASNQQLVKDRNKLEELNERLDSISKTDKLTQLSNRLQVDDVLQKEVYRARERNGIFSIILLDIDFFKMVNDTHGHQIGDQILIEFASILKSNSRRMDVVGRWGGEEFILILPDTPLEGAVIMAEKIRVAIENFNFTEVGQKTASLGVGEYSKDHTLDETIKRIDDALYRAKEEGRNRVKEG